MKLGLVVYLIGVLNGIKVVSGVFMFSSAIVLFALGFFMLLTVEDVDFSNKEDLAFKLFNRLNRLIKLIFIGLFISISISIFAPNEKTSYKILIASQVTPENISKTTEVAKQSIDYIFEKVDNLLDSDKK